MCAPTANSFDFELKEARSAARVEASRFRYMTKEDSVPIKLRPNNGKDSRLLQGAVMALVTILVFLLMGSITCYYLRPSSQRNDDPLSTIDPVVTRLSAKLNQVSEHLLNVLPKIGQRRPASESIQEYLEEHMKVIFDLHDQLVDIGREIRTFRGFGGESKSMMKFRQIRIRIKQLLKKSRRKMKQERLSDVWQALQKLAILGDTLKLTLSRTLLYDDNSAYVSL